MGMHWSCSLSLIHIYGGSSVTQTTDQKELTRALEKIADNEEKAEKLKAAIKQLQNASSSASMKHMKKELDELSAETRQQPSQKVYTEFQNLTMSYNHLLDTLNAFLKEADEMCIRDRHRLCPCLGFTVIRT